ncbi:MAG TPA: PTS sugar transporter subunit IIA, partial [Candidatus Omnitrophota bacterium]|nr:PTS sugar transporter subunit IIA [Candidatus Omnitrophota bacterium]
MKITEFLDIKGIKLELEATDKEGVLREMVDLLTEIKEVGDQKAILKALIERENLGSTGIGQGIAIPHGKTDKVDGLAAVLG